MSDLLRAMFGLEAYKYQWKLWKRILLNYQEFKTFILSYESFDVRSVQIESFILDHEYATVTFKCNVYGLSNSLFVDYIDWDGTCRLNKCDGIWYVEDLSLPIEK